MASHENQVELLSEEELDALCPTEEAVDKLLDQSMGLAEFVEELEEIKGSGFRSGVRGRTDADPQKSARANASMILRKSQPSDAELRLIERFAPSLDASFFRNLCELSALFGIIACAEYALNGCIGSYEVHPHPYWILVIPMSASRGIMSGLLAAGIATVLFMIGAYQVLELDRVIDLLTYNTMQEPLRFGFAAFFIGQFRHELAVRYRTLWRRFMHLQEATEHILRHNTVLTEANESYKTRLLDHSAEFGNLIDIARRQETASARDIFALALELIEEHCNASVCSVLLPGRSASAGFELAAERGWDESFLRQKLAESSESEIVRIAVREGMRINSLAPGSACAPGLGPLMVAPVFDESRAVCALVCLDQLPADRLSKSTASLFFGIADWVDAGLAKVRGEQHDMVPEVPLELRRRPWLGSPVDLGRHVFFEDARCTRISLSTSLLGLQAHSQLGDSTDAVDALDNHVLSALGAQMRDTDTIFRFGYPGCYVILLPGTSIEGAEIKRERVEKWLRYTSADELGNFSIGAFAPNEAAPDLASLLDVVAEHFRGSSETPLDHRCPVEVADQIRLGDIHQFVRRLRMEMGIALRNEFDLFVVRVFVERGDEIQLDAFSGHVEAHAKQTLRATDGVFEIGDQRFALMLPGATMNGAFGCAAGVVAALQSHLPAEAQYRLKSDVFAAHGGAQQLDILLQQLLSDERVALAEEEVWE